MSPYAAMFPYIHQDPASFYANSPYTQPLMLMPQAAEYRNPGPQHHSPYRGVPPPPTYPANASPYGSPAPIRPYDIGKDFAGVNLAGLSVDEGIRGSKALGGSTAPFGGMFGSLPGFDGPLPSHAAPGAGIPSSTFPSIASSGSTSVNTPGSAATPNSYKHLSSAATSGRSGSLDHGDKSAVGRESSAGIPADNSASARPPPQHSRSASLLYGTKQSGSPSAGIN